MQPLPDLDNRLFRGVVNYDDGDLTPDTRFRYFQKGRAVWGEMRGGVIAHGDLVARQEESGTLNMRWQYVTIDGRVVSGSCRSMIEVLEDGRVRLHETWTIDGSDGYTGTSVIEEIRE
jgi:hypothetical protein